MFATHDRDSAGGWGRDYQLVIMEEKSTATANSMSKDATSDKHINGHRKR